VSQPTAACFALRLSVFVFKAIPMVKGAWGSVVVKALCYLSEGLGIDPRWCHWGFFPRLPTEPCALGSTQPVKMSTWKTPGGKDGRCVRVKTLPPS
jgi:hypothetical protein